MQAVEQAPVFASHLKQKLGISNFYGEKTCFL